MNTITNDVTRTTNEVYLDVTALCKDRPLCLGGEVLASYFKSKLYDYAKPLVDALETTSDWIKIRNKGVFYIKSENLIVPDLDRFQIGSSSAGNSSPANLYLTFSGYDGSLLSSCGDVKRVFFSSSSQIHRDLITYYEPHNEYWTCNSAGSCYSFGDYYSTSYHIPVYRPAKYKNLIETLLVENLIPFDLKRNVKNILVKLQGAFGESFDYSKSLAQNIVDNPSLLDALKKLDFYSDDELINFVTNLYEKGELPVVSLTDDALAELCDSLLKCDTYRIDLDAYQLNKVTDINDGHWELWSEDSTALDGYIKVRVNSTLVGRNPLADVRKDGIIGIDFGTKSTVVAYQDGSSVTNLFRIGAKKLSNKVTNLDYENPTIMEYIDLSSFLQAYRATTGRPNTHWEDLKVSHSANRDMKDIIQAKDYHYFSSYFFNLKQWCNSTEKGNLQITDIKHKTIFEVPPYLELDTKEDSTFDPIELYAYYLGMFINNMRNGIYLNYWLSFPVMCTKVVRNKVVESFTKGIKKSLPVEVLNDAEVMKGFSVNIGTTEPASYAICALQEYNVEPTEDENIFYGVFDFGGGTTDFDFGIYRYSNEDVPSERFKDYVIERFGENGDQYLGGENLLELLAFEIFKANADTLLENPDNPTPSGRGFQFCKPEYCPNVAGCETLIDSTSQIAKLNTKQLVEALRPFWEHLQLVNNHSNDGVPIEPTTEETVPQTTDGSITITPTDGTTTDFQGIELDVEETQKYLNAETFSIKGGWIKVDLFNNDGEICSNIQLDFNSVKSNIHVDLLGILESRVSKGVELFCQAMLYALSSSSFKAKDITVSRLVVFLAGNSSQSPLVTKLFQKHTNEYFKGICNSLDIDIGRDFEIYPPLGSEQARAVQKANNSLGSNGYTIPPSGKTGVAYGLIESRPSSKILVLDEVDTKDEVSFPYYIGYEKRKKFYTVIPRASEYKQWTLFTNALCSTFELYYTKRLDVQNGGVPIKDSEIYKKLCSIPQVYSDADVFVYVRIVTPNTLEYVVAKQDGITEGIYLCEPITVEI